MKYIFVTGTKEAKLLDNYGCVSTLVENGHRVIYKFIDVQDFSKNTENLFFLDRFARFLYFLEKSRFVYSYYHAVFERLSLTKPIRSIVIQLIGRFLRGRPKLVCFLRNAIEVFRAKVLSFKSTNNTEKDIYVFFNILSTKIELDYFYQAVHLKAKRVLVQTYWDNITSKVYVPIQGFDSVVCWGKESVKNFLQINHSEPNSLNIAFPFRCNYLKSVTRGSSNSLILYAPTQKKLSSDIDNLYTLDDVATELTLRTGVQYTVIYRPHPYSRPSDLPSLQKFKSIKIDSAYQTDNNKNLDIPFSSQDDFNDKSYESLVDNLGNACCILSQAGTLCLEARSLSIPVFVLLNESYQVTLKLSHFMTHFNELFSDPGVFPIFSQNQLRNCLLKINFNDSYPSSMFVKNSLTFEPNLADILQNEKLVH